MALKPSKPSPTGSLITAVTIAKCSQLGYQAYELTIENGKVIHKRALGRGAPDVAEIQIGRCDDILWSIREQDDKDLKSVENI